MVVKKARCCLSARWGTLFFLYLFLGNSWVSLFSIFTDLGDPMYKQFLKHNSHFYYPAIYIAFTGGLIFLANIISITSNKSSMSLLISATVFSALHAMYGVFSAFKCTIHGIFNDFLNDVLRMRDEESTVNFQNEQPVMIKQQYPNVLKIVCVSLVIDVYFSIYGVLVLLVYIIELKRNHIDGSRVRKNVEDNKANFPKPIVYKL